MTAVIDRLQCRQGVVEVAMRIGVAVTDAAVERVIALTLYAEVPLLTDQEPAGVDNRFIIFFVIGSEHGHHA